MKHGSKKKKLGRVKSQREALLNSLASSMIKHGAIKTTEAKAKALRPYVEKLVTKARKGDLNTRRSISAKIGDSAEKLFNDIAPHYAERKGGYTRIIKMGVREEDGSPMAKIEFV